MFMPLGSLPERSVREQDRKLRCRLIASQHTQEAERIKLNNLLQGQPTSLQCRGCHRRGSTWIVWTWKHSSMSTFKPSRAFRVAYVTIICVFSLRRSHKSEPFLPLMIDVTTPYRLPHKRGLYSCRCHECCCMGPKEEGTQANVN